MGKPRTVDIERILAECQVEVIAGIGPNMDAEPAVFEYWRLKYYRNIERQLGNNADWNQDKRLVLPLAKRMGAESRRLAEADGLTEITLEIAQAASRWVSNQSVECGQGGGRYCPAEP